MRIRPVLRWAVPLLMAALLAFAAVAQLAVLGRRPPNIVLSAPTLFRGLYGVERSDALPGPGVLLSRAYRWSRPSTTIVLLPVPVGTAAFELEYLNPADTSVVSLSSENGSLGLAPTPTLRRLYAVLPPGAHEVVLEQHGQVVSNDTRTLGVLLSDARWWTLATGEPRVLLRSLAGLPLTLLLCMALGALLRLSVWRLAAGSVMAAFGLAGAAWLWPWESDALQPAVQIALAGACLGAAVALLWRRRVTNLGLLLVAVWLLTTLLFWTPRIDSDGVGYYAYLRSALIDGDLDFANEFDPQISPLPHTPALAKQRTAAGRVVNLWSAGPALAWAPAGVLAHALGSIGRALGIPWRADGYSAPYITLVTFVSALAGLLTLLGCFGIASRFAEPGVAALAAATMYCGSNLLYYALWDGGFAHSLSAAAATWFVYESLALADAPSPLGDAGSSPLGDAGSSPLGDAGSSPLGEAGSSTRRWLSLGAAAGLMILMYWVTALLLVLPLLLLGGQLMRLPRWAALGQAARGALLAGGAMFVCVLPQLLVWRYLYGEWLVAPQGSSFVTPGGFHLAEMLSAAIYGLPWWTPAYFAGLAGCLLLALRRPAPGLAMLAMVLGYMVYNATLPDWHGSGAFGLRRFTVLAPAFAAGLAVVLQLLPDWRSRGALAGALVLWSIHMTTRYLTYSIIHDYLELLRWNRLELVLTTWPEASNALRVVLAASWPLRVLRRPDAGGVLLLAACVVLTSVAMLVYPGMSARAEETKPLSRLASLGRGFVSSARRFSAGDGTQNDT